MQKPPGHAHLPSTYLRIKQPKQLCGDSGTRCGTTSQPLRPKLLFLLSFFVLSVFFFPGLFSFQTLNFWARVQPCCQGTNSLFCQIAKNFKVCLTCTLGRPALGASASHTETWGWVLKAPCVSTLLTFKGARTLLTLSLHGSFELNMCHLCHSSSSNTL